MKQKTAADTALGFATVALTVAGIVSMIWAADQPDWVRSAQSLVFVVAVWAVSAIAQVRADGRLDEMELAAARFGSRWGLVAGVAFMVVVTYALPFQSLLAESADAFGSTHGNPRAVEARIFLLGIVSTFFAQELFRSLLAAGWKWSKR